MKISYIEKEIPKKKINRYENEYLFDNNFDFRNLNKRQRGIIREDSLPKELSDYYDYNLDYKYTEKEEDIRDIIGYFKNHNLQFSYNEVREFINNSL